MRVNETIRNPSLRERWVIRTLVGLGVVGMVYFCWYFFDPALRGEPVLYGMLVAVVAFEILRTLNLYYHYLNIRVPPPPAESTRRPTVDILTTYYPGEPREMVTATLEAIRRIDYPHTAYLCAEADDPQLREVCRALGVAYVTRDTRVDAKAGNINNALRQAEGEVCVILDPDHVPEPTFLDEVIPYFADESVGFVQVAQVYYNTQESLVAKGAAQQTYHFYGPMMLSMNGYGAVNAIGANCTFRRSALDAIGGHAPGLAEDMHTAMRLYERQYTSVYVPKIVARGLVPSTLSAYYHQQLKWSRGTLDLLLRVYPRIFWRLTRNQRAHYLLASLHYLVGLFYLIGFLIPISSLIWSETPWRGDLLLLGLIVAPLAVTNLVLRFYIQKWLIADEERGFHIVGGLLEIGTWWVYVLGFVYSLVNKRIPYLPTAKEDHGGSSLALVVPNVVIAGLSLVAVAYGLHRDLTPYAVVMAGFALLTAGIMGFSVLLAIGTTNRNRQLHRRLSDPVREAARWARRGLLGFINRATIVVRATAVPAVILTCVLSAYGVSLFSGAGWRGTTYVNPERVAAPRVRLAGVFWPTDASGRSSPELVARASEAGGPSFDIVAAYEAWGDSSRLPTLLTDADVPLITWEPWVSTFSRGDSVGVDGAAGPSLRQIAAGHFDEYVRRSARAFRTSGKPVLLRFAHEFDNPSYPWSPSGGNTPDDFVAAWRHVHDLFRELGVANVAWVWNPWKADALAEYYPGDDYVDWVGLTVLNYGPRFGTIPDLEFEALYTPLHAAVSDVSRKPILLAEFASLGSQERKRAWLRRALEDIEARFPEIQGIVAFNSSFDMNPPVGEPPLDEPLDWSIDDLSPVADYATYRSKRSPPRSGDPRVTPLTKARATALGRVVDYRQGGQWHSSHHPLSRENLERDFTLMRRWRVDAIKVTRPGIYTHNLLQVAEEFGLGVVYEFALPEPEVVTGDGDAAEQALRKTLAVVGEYLDREVIAAWGFSRDQMAGFAARYPPPLRRAITLQYERWIARAAAAVAATDPTRPVLTDSADFVGVDRWRDSRQYGRVSFDGLLDASGRIKADVGAPIAIARRSHLITAGETHTFRAVELAGTRWYPPNEGSRDESFEWDLVAKDYAGRQVSIRSLGRGKQVSFEIPPDYGRYELLLSRVTGDSVRAVRGPLTVN